RSANVDIVTLGQYLQPSRKNLAVVEYVKPHKFKYWEKIARRMGFLYVVSGALVRSSYRAGELYIRHLLSNHQP
ncbi:MAG: lipoyl synthase, partial [Candidatus Hodarchaeota archaeon]